MHKEGEFAGGPSSTLLCAFASSPPDPASCRCSVSKSSSTLCDPVNCSTPGFPVLHYLQEFAQVHVHWVGDTIQPSHPLPMPSPSVHNLSQHQGLFQWVGSLHQVARVLELQHQSFQWIFKVMALFFNTLSRFVIAFLSRSKHLLISWLQSQSAVIFGTQENKVCHCFLCFPIYWPWSDGTGCHDLSFLNVEF